MPVKLVAAIRDGWKQEDNKRFGQCLEVRFIDTATNKIMFRYAPLLTDRDLWESVFNWLEVYDQKHKEIFAHVQKIEGLQSFSGGDCARCE